LIKGKKFSRKDAKLPRFYYNKIEKTVAIDFLPGTRREGLSGRKICGNL
jgi:hypothetical protein